MRRRGGRRDDPPTDAQVHQQGGTPASGHRAGEGVLQQGGRVCAVATLLGPRRGDVQQLDHTAVLRRAGREVVLRHPLQRGALGVEHPGGAGVHLPEPVVAGVREDRVAHPLVPEPGPVEHAQLREPFGGAAGLGVVEPGHPGAGGGGRVRAEYRGGPGQGDHAGRLVAQRRDRAADGRRRGRDGVGGVRRCDRTRPPRPGGARPGRTPPACGRRRSGASRRRGR